MLVRRTQLLALLLLFIMAPLVHASSWTECRVIAKVIDVAKSDYDIIVLSSTVTDGSTNIGSQCLHRKRFTITTDDNYSPSVGEEIELLYSHYNAMGPDGPISETSWKYVRVSSSEPGDSKKPNAILKFFRSLLK